MANQSSYIIQVKNRLKAIIDTIAYDSGTLGSLGLVYTRRFSIMNEPHTEINIYFVGLGSVGRESNLNRRTYNFAIRVNFFPEGREATAQDDYAYIVEQIITKLENSSNDSEWSDSTVKGSELDNSNLEFTPFEEIYNFYQAEMIIPIKGFVTTNN